MFFSYDTISPPNKIKSYSKPKEPFHHDYSVKDGLDKLQLERANGEVYLGVTFDSLDFDHHSHKHGPSYY